MRYPVDTHTHTIASTHAYSTLLEYIPVAKSRGIKLFATTDHGPQMADAPHIWHFGNLRIVPRLIDGVGILRGVEANILNVAGEIDIPEKVLETLDIVLGSFHEPVFAPVDRETHTQALIAAMASGKIDIIAHPGNPLFEVDIEAVVKAAIKYNVAIEVNNTSFGPARKGSASNCRRFVEVARDLGAKLAFASDSHIVFSLGQYDHCEALRVECKFPIERIISRSVDALLSFLESRGHARIPEFEQLRAEA